MDHYRRGILAMAPAIVVATIPSVLFNWPWPLEPIAEKVMLTTPVDLAQQLLLRLGPLARPLGLFGGFAVALVIGGIVALIALPMPGAPRPRLSPIRALLALAVLVLALFVLFPPLFLPPTIILGVSYLTFLAMPLPPVPHRRTSHNDTTRSAFLSDSVRLLTATGLLVVLLQLEPWYRALTVYRRGGRLFAAQPPSPRLPGFDLVGLTPEVTPPGQFYYMSKNLVDPDLSSDGWSLRIDGLVAHPRSLSFDDLLALPARSQYVTQECVSNPVGGPLMSCALFTGVTLRRLLAMVEPLPAAATLVMRAPDGHTDSIPLTLARHPDVLLAFGMDGKYLDRAHGYPARMLIPGSYGFKSIKWLDHLELAAHDIKGTWQERGWTADAIVHTTARIDLARRDAQGTLVAGIAFAGTRGIQAVQVRANGGRWANATLHVPPLSPLTWVQWRVTIPMRGRLRLEARAIDRSGTPQEPFASDIYPAGATGYHQITVVL